MKFSEIPSRIVLCPACGVPVDVLSFMEGDELSIPCPACAAEIEVNE